MKIAEIFYSIQGEGVLAGVPSVFVRTSECNLRCTWCDTPYTSWKPQFEEAGLGTILAEVRRHWCHHVVVTGGEPLIADEIEELTEKLKSICDQHITIETAGTVYRKVTCDLMSISPKLANSTPTKRAGGKFAQRHEELRYQPDVLKQLIRDYDYQLKFVVAEKPDVDEIRGMVKELGADPSKVLLMPEGMKAKVLHERSLWLVEACKIFGFRFTPRLHVELWGAKRGV